MSNAPRIRTLVLAALALAPGCYAALPPPRQPRIAGTVLVHGGALGDWALDATTCAPAPGMAAIDLTNPASPGRVVRILKPQPAMYQGPRPGIVEQGVRRETQIRIANTSGGRREVLLTREHCSRLDAILVQESGSVAFDCFSLEDGHIAGSAEFSFCLGDRYPGPGTVSGTLQATGGELGSRSFTPNRCSADREGTLLWDVLEPHILLDVRRGPPDESITGSESNASVTVTTTLPGGKSFALSPGSCRTLRLESRSGGFMRVGQFQTTFYDGSLQIDCAAPMGGRIVGTIRFDPC